MTTVAIVQAHLASTRFPNKVLAGIVGQPMLKRVMGRLARAKSSDMIVVAMPCTPENTPLLDLCLAEGWPVSDGPDADVLSRYYAAAQKFEADVIVRVTSDCPLVDPGVVDAVVSMFKSGCYDYVSNNLRRTFPHGLDVECFSRAALERCYREATQPNEREHVTLYMQEGNGFKLGNLASSTDMSKYRLTVDWPEDLTLIQAIYYELGDDPALQSIVSFLDSRPDLMRLNAHRSVA